jgi:hypothetical protein
MPSNVLVEKKGGDQDSDDGGKKTGRQEVKRSPSPRLNKTESEKGKDGKKDDKKDVKKDIRDSKDEKKSEDKKDDKKDEKKDIRESKDTQQPPRRDSVNKGAKDKDKDKGPRRESKNTATTVAVSIPVPPPKPKTDEKGVVVLDEKEKQLAEREARIAELEKKLKEANEAKAGDSGGISIDDIIAGGGEFSPLPDLGEDFAQLSDNPMDDIDFVKRNIEELSGKLSSMYGIDIDSLSTPITPARAGDGYTTDESGMLVRNLVDMTSAVDHAILGGSAMHSDSMQKVLNDILPDLPMGDFSTSSLSSGYGMSSMSSSSPLVVKERPWIILRRFNKRGGKKVQLPESMIELKILASDKFEIECASLREAETEAEVEDINGIKGDSVLLVLTAEENEEFD